MDERTYEELSNLYSRRFGALGNAMLDVERFELFIEALGEFSVSTQQVIQNKGLFRAENWEDNALIPLAELVDGAARQVLYSIVNMFGHQCAYNSVAALMDVDEEIRQIQKKRKRNRKRGRNR
jgi:hypothetical protein